MEKNSFCLNLSLNTGFIKNICLNKSLFYARFTLFKHVKKTNFLSISVLPSEVVIFLLKREVLCEFSRNFFKRTEKHSLAVCDSLWGEKQFLLEFVPFYWFDQKMLFKQILILLWIYPFQRCYEKQIS